MSKQSLSYKDAGVDINAGNALVERIKPEVKRTTRAEVIRGTRWIWRLMCDTQQIQRTNF